MKFKVSPAGEVSAETLTVGSFEKLLSSDLRLLPYLADRDSLMIQVIYSQIDRDRQNRPTFRDYYFNVNPARYFYPASTVKFPTALLALEKLEQLGIDGLDPQAAMVTGHDFPGQTEVLHDPTTPDGRPTMEHYIKKLFLVSDNDAQNRLYEFLGQKYLNDALRVKGYQEAEILHRLSISMSEEENRHTNPVSFYSRSGKKLYEQVAQYNDAPFFLRADSLGKGYYSNGKRVEGPMDFSRKNRISLPSLHHMLKAVMFPEAVSTGSRFRIKDSTLRMVRKYMSQYPGESRFPVYRAPTFYPAYVKFLLFGSDPQARIPPDIRIFNKVGTAYGFLIDVAYVADFANQVEFMVSAVIYCNSDGILNDDRYDYDTLGFPFFKYLGETIYSHELKRIRENKPDLEEFRFVY